MATWARRGATAAVVVLCALVGVVVSAGSAAAHNVLLSTSPSPGSTVPSVPVAVVLTFDKPAFALGTAVEVLGESGDVASGAPVLVDTTVRESIRAGAPAGTYTVRWRVTSADGHPVSGSFTFSAAASGGDPGATAPPATGEPASTTTGGGVDGRDMPRPLLWWGIVGAAAVPVTAAAIMAVARRRPTRPDSLEEPG